MSRPSHLQGLSTLNLELFQYLIGALAPAALFPDVKKYKNTFFKDMCLSIDKSRLYSNYIEIYLVISSINGDLFLYWLECWRFARNGWVGTKRRNLNCVELTIVRLDNEFMSTFDASVFSLILQYVSLSRSYDCSLDAKESSIVIEFGNSRALDFGALWERKRWKITLWHVNNNVYSY